MPAPDANVGTRRPGISKVPPTIGAMFWLIKVLTTGMGEAASDFLGEFNLVLAGAVGLLGIAVALWLQLRVRRYVVGVYWFAVSMVAVFGTMAADGLHAGIGIPYPITTCFYAVVVALILWRWFRSERTLSIHSITTLRRERFYWATVLATFALGTALGDLTAVAFGLGFFASGLLFVAVIAVPALGWWHFGLNPIFSFWFAYVATRPLGASFADWLGKPHSVGGGLGFGDSTVTVVAIVAIVALVVLVSRRPSTRASGSPLSDTNPSVRFDDREARRLLVVDGDAADAS